MSKRPIQPHRTRGAVGNPDNRYEALSRERFDDGWGALEQEEVSLVTELSVDSSRSIISYNESPDIPFDRSINPYRGCEHGCVYCFARPTHAWLGLSPGLDFESRLAYKPEAAALLKKALAKRNYTPAPLMLGINTDAYQPVERRLRITRQLLEVLHATRHPFGIVTKSALVERDIDLLAELAQANLCQVAVSVTSLDRSLSRRLEPRTAVPERRLETIARLSEAGIPVSVLVAPVIPVLTDAEIERILERAREAGALSAGYVLLRLPHEVKELFRDWLAEHAPQAAEHVMSRVRETRGGKEYDARFGSRMRGSGQFAELIAQRFHLASRRLGFTTPPPLRCDLFTPPREETPQMSLF